MTREGFLSRFRGDDFCPFCGEEVKWARLISGMWLAVRPEPTLYAPGKGRMWLVDQKWDGQILKDCLIYRRGLGIDAKGLKKGLEPHVFSCSRGAAR